MEIINFIFGILLVIGAFVFMIGSSVLVHEKKQRQRAGLTDYYDQPIITNRLRKKNLVMWDQNKEV